MSLLLLFPSAEAPPVVGTTLYCVHGPELFAGGAKASDARTGGAELSDARVGGADRSQVVRGEDRR